MMRRALREQRGAGGAGRCNRLPPRDRRDRRAASIAYGADLNNDEGLVTLDSLPRSSLVCGPAHYHKHSSNMSNALETVKDFIKHPKETLKKDGSFVEFDSELVCMHSSELGYVTGPGRLKQLKVLVRLQTKLVL